MKEYQITVLKGDGIGPEIVDQAIKVLNKTAEKFDFKVNYQEEYIGGAAIDATGEPLPQKTVDSCKASDAVILGAVGIPFWSSYRTASRCFPSKRRNHWRRIGYHGSSRINRRYLLWSARP